MNCSHCNSEYPNANYFEICANCQRWDCGICDQDCYPVGKFALYAKLPYMLTLRNLNNESPELLQSVKRVGEAISKRNTSMIQPEIIRWPEGMADQLLLGLQTLHGENRPGVTMTTKARTWGKELERELNKEFWPLFGYIEEMPDLDSNIRTWLWEFSSDLHDFMRLHVENSRYPSYSAQQLWERIWKDGSADAQDLWRKFRLEELMELQRVMLVISNVFSK